MSTEHVVGVSSGDGGCVLVSEGYELNPVSGGTLDDEDVLVVVDGLREVGYEVEVDFGEGFVGNLVADAWDGMADIAGLAQFASSAVVNVAVAVGLHSWPPIRQLDRGYHSCGAGMSKSLVIVLQGEWYQAEWEGDDGFAGVVGCDDAYSAPRIGYLDG